jgi:hypothetical protein
MIFLTSTGFFYNTGFSAAILAISSAIFYFFLASLSSANYLASAIFFSSIAAYKLDILSSAIFFSARISPISTSFLSKRGFSFSYLARASAIF